MSGPRVQPESIREIAQEVGFDVVRFGPADPGEHGGHFVRWLEQGRHGDMAYLERNRDRILEPTAWRSGVRSSISVAVDYGGPPGELSGGGRVARYATNRDYHRWLKGRVFTLRERLEQAGLPVEGIALIIGVDRLLDMVRTAVNVTGDATISVIVGKSEGQFDESIFLDPDADQRRGERDMIPGI